MSDYTTMLFSDASFAEGLGRLIDSADCLTQWNHSQSAMEADAKAFWADAAQVGDDLRNAMNDHSGVEGRSDHCRVTDRD